MKRHMRDEHEICSGSASPPLKRKRRISTTKSENIESMDVGEENVEDLSSSFEDMEIDDSVEELLQERSNLMDEKIKEKERFDHEKNEKLKTFQNAYE